jgi:uncharacterized protein
MTIRNRLEADLKEALRTGDALRASTFRLARAALRNAEMQRGRTLTDAESATVLEDEVRRRREALAQYQRADRSDLVQDEQLELAILLAYVPRPAAGGRPKTELGRRR